MASHMSALVNREPPANGASPLFVNAIISPMTTRASAYTASWRSNTDHTLTMARGVNAASLAGWRRMVPMRYCP